MLTEESTIINEEELKDKLTQVSLGHYTKKALNKITKDDINKKIETFGWVWSSRVQPKMTFLELYSGFKKMKCVAFTTEKTLTQWSSVKVYGEVRENKGKDEYEFEFFIEKLVVFGKADTFPINSETSAFTMLEKGHLALRTPERILFLKARSHLLRIMRDFFYQEDCIEITPPTLVQTQVEGGSTLFKLKYYDSDAFLTQSSQLYLETVVPVSNKAFCIMPSYRAEKSNTRRHLSEYTHVEAEFADICFDDLVSFIQRMLIYSVERFYTDLEKEIKEVYPSFEKVKTSKVTRMKYSEAIKFLQERKQVKSDGTPYEDNDDIPDHAERYLCSEFGIVILTHFLVEHKPFYMRRAGNETESLDVLFPDVGEIVGGSMRCEDYDELIDGFKREGIDPEPYYWYTDLLKYGTFSHGGFGLGFERLLMGLLKYNSVNKACLYPRFTTRCAP